MIHFEQVKGMDLWNFQMRHKFAAHLQKPAVYPLQITVKMNKKTGKPKFRYEKNMFS
jgi:hypothetical protein